MEFLGEYEHSLDGKGRLTFPARLREGLGGALVMARSLGNERCIQAYPLAEWEKVRGQLDALPAIDEEARRMKRRVFSSAFRLGVDRLGRVVLPAPLRDFAQIRDGAVIVGVNTYLEIWSQELWTEEKTAMTQG